MLKSLLDRLVRSALSDTPHSRNVRLALFPIIVVPVLLVATISSVKTYMDLTQATLARRQAIASLAASVLKERIDRLMDLGLSFATRPRVRGHVANSRWEEAIQFLQDTPRDFPSVERVFLVDLKGILRADAPALPGVRGEDFSHRDWYKGVSREWKS